MSCIESQVGDAAWKVPKMVHYSATDGPANTLSDYPFTMAIWVNPPTTGSISYGAMTDASGIGTGTYYFSMKSYFSGSNLVFRPETKSNEGTDYSLAYNTGAYTTRRWIHLCVVWTSSSDREMFVDGVSVVTSTASRTFEGYDSIGIGNGSTDIDDTTRVAWLSLYDKALSLGEINEVMWRPRSRPNLWQLAGLQSAYGETASNYRDWSGNGWHCNTMDTHNGTFIDGGDGPPCYF